MDLTAFNQTAETFANAFMSFPMWIEVVLGTVLLAPFVDQAAQFFGLSSMTDLPTLSSVFAGSSQS